MQTIRRRVIALVFSLLFGLSAAQAAPPGKLVFSHRDPAGDDKGPGSYQYPSAKIFRDNPGIFDLRAFRVYDDGETVRFELDFQNRIPRQGYGVSPSAFGFHLLMCDIYIDQDHRFNSGIQRSLAGRNVRFKPENAWDRMVLISPMRDSEVEEALRQKVEDLEMVGFKDRVITPLEVHFSSYTLKAFVPKSRLGQPDPRWGYQVLISGYDPEDRTVNSFYNIPVKAFAGPIQFGGGTNSAGSPQVLDMLTPDGQNQSSWLGDYRPHFNPQRVELAFVPMIYSPRGELLTRARTEMKLPGVGLPDAGAGEMTATREAGPDPVDDAGFLSQLRAEGYILPVDDLARPALTMAEADTGPEPAVAEEVAVTEKKLVAEVSAARNATGAKTTPDLPKETPQSRETKAPPNPGKSRTVDQRLAELRRQAGGDDLGSRQWLEKEFGSREEVPLRRRTELPAAGMGFDTDLQRYLTPPPSSPAVEKLPQTVEPASRQPRRSRSIFSRFLGGGRKTKTAGADERGTRTGKRGPETATETPDEEAVERKTAPVVTGGTAKMDRQAAECAVRAKELIAKAETYLERYPQDTRISMSDLRRAGLIGDTPHCPAGGRYVILLENGRPTVECIDVNGSGHGTIRADEGGKP